MRKDIWLATAGFATVALGGGNAWAMEPGAGVGMAQGATLGAAQGAALSEVVVTAQKRPQRLEDTPVAVTALDARSLADAGVRDIKDLTVLVPGLMVTTTSSPAVTTARIRGVGTVGDNAGLEPSVGVVIDGVYRPRNGVALGDLGAVERIEVLKGPQGTLFGKNTTAGVINVVTARPSFVLGAGGEVTAGNYSQAAAAVSLTGPILADRLAGRIDLSGRSRDGFYRETHGGRVNDEDYYTGRAQLLFTPSADLSVNLSADATRRHERCCGAVQLVNGPSTPLLLALSPAALVNPPDPSSYREASNRSFLKRVVDEGSTLTVDWKTPWLGGAQFTAVTGYRLWSQTGASDVDWTGLDLLYAPGAEDPYPGSTKFRTFSQDARLSGVAGPLTWLVGAAYTHETLGLHVRNITYGTDYGAFLNTLLGGQLPLFTGLPPSVAFRPGAGQDDFYRQAEHSAALYANGTLALGHGVELTGGLRHDWEHKRLSTLWSNTDGALACNAALAQAKRLGGPIPASGAFIRAGGLLGALPYQAFCATFENPRFGQIGTNAQRLSEGELTGTAKLSWRMNPRLLAYVSYARGYKAGGFNLDRSASGLQTVAGQATAPDLDTRFAPETVDSYEAGMRADLFARRLRLGATAFHQVYHGFQLNGFNGVVFSVSSVPRVLSDGVDADATWATPVPGLTLSGGVTYAQTRYPADTPVSLGANLRGGRISFAPLWSGSATATYERPLTERLTGRLSVSAKAQSSYNTGSDLDPAKVQPGFTLVNARAAVASADGLWSVEAWAQNLFDKTYRQVVFSALFQTGSYDAYLGAPRTYGVTIRKRY